MEICEDEYGNYIKPASEITFTFNDKEMKILDLVNQKFKHMNSKDTSNFSHKEKCWIETPHKHPISYLYSEFMEANISRL
ncbi:type II toxin-antitoxin system antitoxin SocA domain-containing protein [Desulforamulus aquiferis]|uniref:type II toxin-antitoxin system antitoxin SocA domain-containing protein n=1 Tax=Desulforamulus aquiferis TaxID=1397668 RepID=UPI003570B18C